MTDKRLTGQLRRKARLIDARRSNGEQALSELTGKTLLLPKDRAFHPDAKGLEWRVRNLVA